MKIVSLFQGGTFELPILKKIVFVSSLDVSERFRCEAFVLAVMFGDYDEHSANGPRRAVRRMNELQKAELGTHPATTF